MCTRGMRGVSPSTGPAQRLFFRRLLEYLGFLRTLGALLPDACHVANVIEIVPELHRVVQEDVAPRFVMRTACGHMAHN